jgi:hypothetical protein
MNNIAVQLTMALTKIFLLKSAHCSRGANSRSGLLINIFGRFLVKRQKLLKCVGNFSADNKKNNSNGKKPADIFAFI